MSRMSWRGQLDGDHRSRNWRAFISLRLVRRNRQDNAMVARVVAEIAETAMTRLIPPLAYLFMGALLGVCFVIGQVME